MSKDMTEKRVAAMLRDNHPNTETYLCEYQFEGRDYSLPIRAHSMEQAKAHVEGVVNSLRLSGKRTWSLLK